MPSHRVRLVIAVRDEDAEQYAGDVRVQDRRTSPECKAQNGAGSVGADALEGSQRRLVARQHTAVAGHRLSRDRLQAPGPDVVAEWVPCPRHVCFGRRRERGKARILLEPFAILRQHPIDLGLLEHHLGNEDVIGVGRAAPGQIAAVAPIPGEQPAAEALAFIRAGQGEHSII